MKVLWWVFEKYHTPEQTADWWQHCYYVHPTNELVQGIDRSVVILGEKGGGKSVLLQSLEFANPYRPLVVQYNLDHRRPRRTETEYGHIGQMMRQTGTRIKHLIQRDPRLLEKLDEVNAKYLRWLLDKYLSKHKRAFRIFLGDLTTRPGWEDVSDSTKKYLKQISLSEFEDYYETDSDEFDVRGQIEELVTLCRVIGYTGVTILIDINTMDIDETKLTNVKTLFEWLLPFQITDFSIKTAIPQSFANAIGLKKLVRERANIIALEWTLEQCQSVCELHLKRATNSNINRLEDIATPQLLKTLTDKLPYLREAPVPRYWLWFTHALLLVYEEIGQLLTIEQEQIVLQTYFEKFIKLSLDKKAGGVWRGPEFVKLTEQALIFLSVLWDGNFSETPNAKLVHTLGSKVNVNTVASRVRTAIEPLLPTRIYLKNTRQDGYWLENTE